MQFDTAYPTIAKPHCGKHYREAVTATAQGCRASPTTLGKESENIINPNGVVSGSGYTGHNPVGVGPLGNPVPRVAAKRDNPGLCYVTASR